MVQQCTRRTPSHPSFTSPSCGSYRLLAGTGRTACLDGIAAGARAAPEGVVVREVKTPHFVLSELNRTDETTQCAPTNCGAPHIRAEPCHAMLRRGVACSVVP